VEGLISDATGMETYHQVVQYSPQRATSVMS
jgi:hypothetical protein